MINCQKFNFLLFLTINSVTSAVRELNGTSQISLVAHDAVTLKCVKDSFLRKGLLFAKRTFIFAKRTFIKAKTIY